MKFASKMFTLTALALACSAASAQQSAPLTVTGNITPPGCTASMSNDGTFKYPDIDASTLNDTSGKQLDALPTSTFSISCLGAAQVAWSITDNRADSPYWTDDAGYMGLGKDKDGNKIGEYFLKMSQPVLDSTNAFVVYSNNGGVRWDNRERNGYMLRRNQLYTYTYNSGGGDSSILQRGKLFSATMAVYTTIAPKNTLNTTGAIDLDGSSTINLTYL